MIDYSKLTIGELICVPNKIVSRHAKGILKELQKEPKEPSDDEVREYMIAHNNDEVGQGDNAWTFEEAKYHLLLSDKYYYLNN